MEESGIVGTDSESWGISTNDVKFNVVLKDWVFCDDCVKVDKGNDDTGGNGNGNGNDNTGNGNGNGNSGNNGNGNGNGNTGNNGNGKRDLAEEVVSSQFVDVSIQIKGKGEEPIEEDPVEGIWDLGGGVSMFLSNRVSVDGGYQAMPDGFPKVKKTGGKTIYTFRFPRFDGSSTYDPIVAFGSAVTNEEEEDDSEENGNDSASFRHTGNLVYTFLSWLFLILYQY